MYLVLASGRISKIERKDLNGSDACVITVPVNTREQVNGQWQDATDWYTLTGWDALSAKWVEKYRVGDLIEFRGEPKVRAFAGNNGPQVSFRIKSPFIEFCPYGRSKEARSEDNQAGAADAADTQGNDFDDVPF